VKQDEMFQLGSDQEEQVFWEKIDNTFPLIAIFSYKTSIEK
jgi:hypothetical protein